MKTFFTSDTHFGHANIIAYSQRPQFDLNDFTPSERWISENVKRKRARQMDDFLITEWNKVVTNDDEVYHLGDFCFGTSEDALRYLNALNFKRLNFIWGNHDKAMKDIYNRNKQPHGFYFAGDMAEVDIAGQTIVLNHYKMAVWNRSHHGAWHLYGHSHGSAPNSPHDLSFDVGVDCTGYKPLSFEEVRERMSKKLWKPIDYHGAKEEGGGQGMSKEAYAKAERKKLYEQLKEEFETKTVS
jgi:calcineurin-like phosphoesterase family protein